MEYVEFFDSLQSFSETINSRPTNKPFKDYYRDDLPSMRGGDHYTKFSGTESFAEADKLMLGGDYESLKKLKEVNLPTTIKRDSAYKTQVRKSVCGSLPNVPLYLRGVPTNMLDFRKTKVPGKTVNMIVNNTTNFLVSAENIVRVGALIAASIKEIEEKGIRVNLYTINPLRGKSKEDKIALVIRLKKAESPLNMLNIAYVMVNPSFSRRHCFRFLETIPVKKIDSEFTKRYGFVFSLSEYINQTDDKRLQLFKDAIKLSVNDLCEIEDDNEVVSAIISQLKM